MIAELIHTSVARGLKPGSRGFTTVAHTRDMPGWLSELLERISGYRFDPAATGAADPQAVLYRHGVLTRASQTYHVLSRIAPCAADYSGRSNRIAHHIVLDPRARNDAGPAWLLQQPGVFLSAWEGEPRLLAQRAALPDAAVDPQPCQAWQDCAGDAGWAGELLRRWQANPRAPLHVWHETPSDMLRLLSEACALLPPGRRWDFTFQTRVLESVPRDMTCAVRCVPDGVGGAAPSGATLDLTQPGALGDHAFAAAARAGRTIDLAGGPAPTRKLRTAAADPAPEESAADEPTPSDAYHLAPALATGPAAYEHEDLADGRLGHTARFKRPIPTRTIILAALALLIVAVPVGWWAAPRLWRLSSRFRPATGEDVTTQPVAGSAATVADANDTSDDMAATTSEPLISSFAPGGAAEARVPPAASDPNAGRQSPGIVRTDDQTPGPADANSAGADPNTADASPAAYPGVSRDDPHAPPGDTAGPPRDAPETTPAGGSAEDAPTADPGDDVADPPATEVVPLEWSVVDLESAALVFEEPLIIQHDVPFELDSAWLSEESHLVLAWEPFDETTKPHAPTADENYGLVLPSAINWKYEPDPVEKMTAHFDAVTDGTLHVTPKIFALERLRRYRLVLQHPTDRRARLLLADQPGKPMRLVASRVDADSTTGDSDEPGWQHWRSESVPLDFLSERSTRAADAWFPGRSANWHYQTKRGERTASYASGDPDTKTYAALTVYREDRSGILDIRVQPDLADKNTPPDRLRDLPGFARELHRALTSDNTARRRIIVPNLYGVALFEIEFALPHEPPPEKAGEPTTQTQSSTTP